jgi:transposase InsO family protein
MGNTFWHLRETRNALEGVIQDGRADALCGSVDGGMSKLSVWWLRLGIGIERIKPGNPQQNGLHERMHVTLKKEATKPPAKNLLQQ